MLQTTITHSFKTLVRTVGTTAFTALLMVLGYAVQAQTYTISGTILGTGSSPISGAVITTQQPKGFTTTDQEGKFSLTLKGKSQDSILIQCQALGYARFVGKVSTQGTTNLELKEQATQYEEVLVQGVRVADDAPIAQTTLTEKEIKQSFYGQDPTALLQSIPNVLASFDAGNALSNYSTIRIRGLDYSRINVTLNGVPLNDMMDQGVFFSNMPDFTNSIRSIQIQRGVGTSTNGTAGYAGSINFESVHLRDQPAGGEVQMGYGSFNTMRYSAAVSSGLKNGWAFYGKYGYLQSDGFRYYSGVRGGSFFGSAGYFGKKDMVRITAFHGHVKNQLAFFPVPLSLIDQDPRTNIVGRNLSDDFGQSLLSVQHAHFFSARHTLTTTGYYGRAGGWFKIDNATTLALVNQHVGVSSIMNYRSADGNLETHLGVQANVFMRENYGFSDTVMLTRAYNNWGRKDEASAFAKVSYKLGAATLFADLQARYAGFLYIHDPRYQLADRSINWAFINPKAGVSYALNENLSAFASVGMVSREPTRIDMLQGAQDISTANQDIIGGFDRVKPESLTDVEAGANLSYSWLRGQVNLFYMDFRNEIAATGQYTPWFEPIRTNVASSYRRGLEWNLAATPAQGWQILFGGAYTQARIKEFRAEFADSTYRDVVPLLTPEWIINYGVNGTVNKYLDVNVVARYSSGSFLGNNNDRNLTTAPFTVVDARATLHYGSNYHLALACNNLLDARFATNGAVGFDGGPALLIQAPRNYMATLTLKF